MLSNNIYIYILLTFCNNRDEIPMFEESVTYK